MNGSGTETPANKIATANATLALAIRLTADVEQQRITSEIYKREVTIHTDGPGLRLPASPESTDEDLRNGIFNFVLLSLGSSALTLDETMDEVFGQTSADADRNRAALRTMIHQLRNAFAHNPFRPKWVIFPKYRRRYLIVLDDGSEFNFDATNLDGKQIKAEDVGGLEFWVKVLQHCEKLAVKNS